MNFDAGKRPGDVLPVGFLGDVEEDSDAAGLGGQAEVARPSFSVSSRCLRAEIVAKRVGVFSILFAIVFAHLGTCRGNG